MTNLTPRPRWPRGLLLGLLAAAASLAGVFGWGEAGSYASPATVGIDMEAGPAENTATTLGEVQSCVEAAHGETVTIDTYVDAIPQGSDLGSFDYRLRFDVSAFELASSVHDDAGINLLASAPGSEVGSSVTGLADGSRVVTYDLGVAEQGPASGVLGRYTISVGSDAGGVYELWLDQAVLFDSAGSEIATTVQPAALLAVSPEGCSSGPAPSPTSTPAPSPTPVPKGTATPVQSPHPTPAESPVSAQGAAMGGGEVGERFLYPPLGFTTRITAFFDHTGPGGGPDGWMQAYTGHGGSDEETCESDPRAYRSESLGVCLHYDGHAGYDYDLPDGVATAIRAAADGCALDVSWDGAFGFQIVLGHENGYRTQYGHLDPGRPHVSKGDCVTAGERIAYGGSTGCECGDHLHFAVLDPSGRPTDPYGWWGGEPDPWSPTSKWLWSTEQPTTNGLPVPSPEDAPGPLRPPNPCAVPALSGTVPAVITNRAIFFCNA